MATAKKISPVEFRLSQKSFNVDYSPANYFEKFRLEIIIQKLVHWIFWKYGLYLYIQRIQLRDNQILFQIYFYPTYIQQRFVEKYNDSFDLIASFQGVLTNDENILAVLNPEIWSRILKLQKKEFRSFDKLKLTHQKKRKVWSKKLKFRRFSIREDSLTNIQQTNLLNYKRIWKIILQKRRRNRWVRNKKLIPQVAFNFYFTHFFQHYFQIQSVVLYKNLLKWFFSNKTFKKEHKKILKTTKYLQRHEWTFDMYFFTHIILVYSNPNFLLHILYRFIAQSKVHKKIFYNFADILQKFYILKRHIIKGIKFALQGVYNRHGRAKLWVWEVGDISYITQRSLILFDWIPFWTRYGSFSVKLWIAYNDRDVRSYRVEIDR